MDFDDEDNFEENEDDFEDEEVGYKNPPKEHQFQPGISGNPSGRPKKQKLDLREHIINLAHEEITYFENGNKKAIPIKTALLKKTAELALKGDKSSIKYLLNILMALDEQEKKEDNFFDFSF